MMGIFEANIFPMMGPTKLELPPAGRGSRRPARPVSLNATWRILLVGPATRRYVR